MTAAQFSREDIIKYAGREEGREEGISLGREEEIFYSVYEKDYTASRGAEKLGISETEFTVKYDKWKEEKKLL